MKALSMILLLLAACGQDTRESASLQDARYRLVEVGADTCILDNRTSLLWQAKKTGTGLHNAANTYSWFDPNEASGELDYRGLDNGGNCDGSGCDTFHYVQAVNDADYCGHSDWRMPGKDELFSISDLRRVNTPPTISTVYFPNTQSGEYWTGNDYSFQYDAAWGWSFEFGHDRVDWKKTPKYVRLVRGDAAALRQVKE